MAKKAAPKKNDAKKNDAKTNDAKKNAKKKNAKKNDATATATATPRPDRIRASNARDDDGTLRANYRNADAKGAEGLPVENAPNRYRGSAFGTVFEALGTILAEDPVPSDADVVSAIREAFPDLSARLAKGRLVRFRYEIRRADKAASEGIPFPNKKLARYTLRADGGIAPRAS